MALSRRSGQRFQGSIWPGFVDAMTGLLLVLMFVLTIFMIVQFVLRETISGQETELDTLSAEVSALAAALGLEELRSNQLQARMGALTTTLNSAQDELEAARTELASQSALIASLTGERDAQDAALAGAETRITSFEAQVAALLADRDRALGTVADLQDERARNLSEQEALNLALAQSRSEIDAQAEAARLSAARREALEALVADLRQRNAEQEAEAGALAGQVDTLQQWLSEEEAARLAEAAAAEALRDRLQNADAELTSMTLALEEQRQKAEDTLTLLAAADALREKLNAELSQALDRITAAEARAGDRDVLAEQLTRVLAQMEAARTTNAETVSALEAELAARQAELDAAQSNAQSSEENRAAVQARLLQALESLERAEAAASDRDLLEARLAAALAARTEAQTAADDQLSLAQQRAVLLAMANQALSEEKAANAESQRQTALLNQQVAALRNQLGSLQALLDDAKERDAAAQIQLQSLGTDLNTALARAAAEERRRRQLEEAERLRLEAEAKVLEEEAKRLAEQAQDLESYRSEFFGRLRDVLSGQEGVRIVGDRFVFSSEVLFPPGGATLSDEGRAEISKIARLLRQIASEIPSEIDWVIRVDGHTDDVPLSGQGEFADNWELSQARALSVVRYLQSFEGISPSRMSANGFGEYHPIDPDDTPEARAQNRRIELKLTER